MNIKELINGVQHVGIPTDNLDKSIKFYETIGFEVIYQTVNEAADEKVAFMQLGNLVMEIYENHRATMKTGSIDHVALDVNDIEKVFEYIRTTSIEMIDDKVMSLPFWANGVKFFTVKGPNNEKTEFCQKL